MRKEDTCRACWQKGHKKGSKKCQFYVPGAVKRRPRGQGHTEEADQTAAEMRATVGAFHAGAAAAAAAPAPAPAAAAVDGDDDDANGGSNGAADAGDIAV